MRPSSAASLRARRLRFVAVAGGTTLVGGLLAASACRDDTAGDASRVDASPDAATGVDDAPAPTDARASDGDERSPTDDAGIAGVRCSAGDAAPRFECAPPPDAPKAPGWYAHGALPRGACGVDAGTCEIGVEECCPCGDWGALNAYTCACDGGVWDCVVTSQGGTICLPFPACTFDD